MEPNEIDISGLNKAALLCALFNGSQQLGMGFLDKRGAGQMTEADAQQLIDARKDGAGWRSYFDYLHGRVMKVDIGGDTLRTALYDRDNGQGAAARVIEQLRQSQAA